MDLDHGHTTCPWDSESNPPSNLRSSLSSTPTHSFQSEIPPQPQSSIHPYLILWLRPKMPGMILIHSLSTGGDDSLYKILYSWRWHLLDSIMCWNLLFLPFALERSLSRISLTYPLLSLRLTNLDLDSRIWSLVLAMLSCNLRTWVSSVLIEKKRVLRLAHLDRERRDIFETFNDLLEFWVYGLDW